MVDDFIDAFASNSASKDINVDVKAPKDNIETEITADFCEETLIQPIQRQVSLEVSYSNLSDPVRDVSERAHYEVYFALWIFYGFRRSCRSEYF